MTYEEVQEMNKLLRVLLIFITLPFIFKCCEVLSYSFEENKGETIELIDLTQYNSEEDEDYEESSDVETDEEESDYEESDYEESESEYEESEYEESEDEESEDEEYDDDGTTIRFDKLNNQNKGCFERLSEYFYPEKKLYILRGVPGSGKEYMIYHMEQNKDTIFGICDRHEYFYKGKDNYQFNSKKIGQAESYSRRSCIKFMTGHMPRIYVTDYFDQVWKYQDYIDLAVANGYEIKIIEMRCPDNDHLRYFNKRNPLKPPMSKSKNCYERWERDPRAFIQEPWVKPFEGDSLPKEKVNEDKILEDYFKYGPIKVEPFTLYKENPEHLEFISDEKVNNILDRAFIF